MIRRKSIATAILGAVAAAAGLALSPGAYAWLRRTLKLDGDRSPYEAEEGLAALAASAPDDSLADARLTLRARLQETGVVAEEAAPVAAAPAPDATAEARSRLRAKVEEAKAALVDEDRTDEIEPVD